MGISVGGLSSGIDVDKIISQMISIERRPQVRLQVKEAGLQGKLTSIGTFDQALTSLQSAASSLRDISSLNTRNISSSDTTILTATASGSVAPGTHSIEVKQLAQVQRLASAGFADTTTTTVGSGTLTIQVGTGTSGVVTIDSSNNTLSGLRDAINNANAGVSASILNDGTLNKLIITANNSGSGNTIKITAIDDDGNNTDMNGLSRFVYDTASAVTNLTQTQAAQNATIKVDGIDNISKSSNTVTDVIEGVTVSLLKAQVGTTVNLNVTQDNSSAKSKIQGFVDGYNKLVKLLNSLQGYDAKTKKGGVLLGDSVVSGIRQKMRNVMTGQVSNLSGSYTSLAQIGIKSSSDGTLTIDSAKLDSALTTNFTAVGKLFAKNAAITDPNITLKGTTADTKSGIYSINITQAAAKGKYTGTALTLPVTITGGVNDSLTVSINGVSGTVTLAAGTYTGTSLAQEIQDKINSSSTFSTNAISASVNFLSATNQLEITSSTLGSASSVNVTGGSARAGLGLNSGTAVQGLNVTGTINSHSAVGTGNRLKGTAGNPEEGLDLEVSGTITGNRGTVSLTYGVAEQLYNEIARIVDPVAGSITKRKDLINASINDIDKENDKIENRLADIEKRLRERFTRLEKTLNSLQSTNNFLTQQFQSMFSNSSNK